MKERIVVAAFVRKKRGGHNDDIESWLLSFILPTMYFYALLLDGRRKSTFPRLLLPPPHKLDRLHAEATSFSARLTEQEKVERKKKNSGWKHKHVVGFSKKTHTHTRASVLVRTHNTTFVSSWLASYLLVSKLRRRNQLCVRERERCSLEK